MKGGATMAGMARSCDQKPAAPLVGGGRCRRQSATLLLCWWCVVVRHGLASQVFRVASFSRRYDCLGYDILLLRNGVSDLWQWVIFGGL